jgi:hypothetical protein
MSHRIIISSLRVEPATPLESLQASVQHSESEPASIDIEVRYTPAHDESEQVIWARLERVQQLMRLAAQSINEPVGAPAS